MFSSLVFLFLPTLVSIRLLLSCPNPVSVGFDIVPWSVALFSTFARLIPALLGRLSRALNGYTWFYTQGVVHDNPPVAGRRIAVIWIGLWFQGASKRIGVLLLSRVLPFL